MFIVAAGHPGTIINILKEENNQIGPDDLFARYYVWFRNYSNLTSEDLNMKSFEKYQFLTIPSRIVILFLNILAL